MEKRCKMINIALMLGYICLSVTGLLLIKMGGWQQLTITNQIISIRISVMTLVGLICYVLSFLLYIIILPRFNLSYIAPITTGVIFTLVILVSLFILKETVGLLQWIGIILILSGVVLMNIKK